MTNLENLVTEIMKMHPEEGSFVKVKKEDMNRAWEVWKISAQKIAPLIDNVHYERIEALERAKNVMLG